MKKTLIVKIPDKHPLSSAEALESFGHGMLAWYDENKRELPWRTSPTLYKTVVSEFMLQQTRVSTVLPYFERWLAKFPDFARLADATEGKVLKAWEGLGYYSRARNLHKLAQKINLLDEIPQDAKTWEGFTGVGPYIAAAVTSISFQAKVAVTDGNVVRVLTRLLAHEEYYRDGASAQRKLRPLAQDLLNHERPGDHNQAIMELGATICHRRSPLCSTCPILSYCKAGKRGDPQSFPRLAKKKIEPVRVERLWITNGNSLLLYEAPPGSKRLAGILELPRPKDLPRNLRPALTPLLATKRRAISNQAVVERIYGVKLPLEFNFEECPNLRFVPFDDLKQASLSAPHRRWIEELKAKETHTRS
jgi:A/G-specific adenine glycosylase